MLKVFKPSESVRSFRNAKCAEVLFQGNTDFMIICTLCEMKSFQFSQFIQHFNNVHLSLQNVPYHLKEDSCSTDRDHLQSISDTFEPENDRDELDGDSESDPESIADILPEIPEGKPPNNDSNLHSCDKCKRSFKYIQTLEQHLKYYHNTETRNKEMKCPRCDGVFYEMRAYDHHVQENHKGFPCDQCNKIFKLKESLHNHKQRHTGIKSFQCDFDECKKLFFDRKQLNNHRRMVHIAERNVVCEFCGYRTKSKSTLAVHLRYHTGEKPYKCKECNKGFASQSLLSDHMPIHSVLRPHKCDVCGDDFSRSKALYHHKFIHLGIKKFVCKVCGKAYAQAAGLSGHMRKHKNQFP